MPADEVAPPLPLLERRLAVLLGASGDDRDVDHREYLSEILITLLDMAGDTSPDDVAEYLGGFVVASGRCDDCGDLREDLRRFSVDVARYKSGGGEGIADSTTPPPDDDDAVRMVIEGKEDPMIPRSGIDVEGSAQQRGSTSGREVESISRSEREENEERSGDRVTIEDECHERALSTLLCMFSDMSYTTRHLDAILRHHGNRIEDAIEALLIHGDGTPDELLTGLSRMSPSSGTVLSDGVDGGMESDAKRIDAAELTRHLFGDVRRRQADDYDYPAVMSSRDGVGGGTGVGLRRMGGMARGYDVKNDGGRRRYGGRGPVGGGERECQRSCVPIGADVFVVKKEDQRTGRETRGVVSRHLTNAEYHPRGIKVMLADGTVGRVIKFAR
ncbi:hypothetical protein ACHAXA_006684 [Cyclostephanos tholiformis]|uniref:Uncharacterized protein n=1 Tax=Cyclostephanos tholiformis TaxID=382380 RepID=A0ABD3RGY9_9STRA